MMGRTHAATGLAAGIGATYVVTVPIPAAILGSILCAGCALVPDIDHHNSTITQTFGPITKALSWLARKISGGHRIGTHSIFGILVLGGLARYGVQNRHMVLGQVVLSVILILGFAGVIRLMKIPGWFDDVAPIPVVIAIVVFTDLSLTIVPAVLMLGCAVHVLGDVVTKEGCPLFWPFSRKRVKLALFKTNGVVERWVVTPLVLASIFGGIFWKLVDTVS